jgi:hypothetical protein
MHAWCGFQFAAQGVWGSEGNFNTIRIDDQGADAAVVPAPLPHQMGSMYEKESQIGCRGF